MYSCRVFEIDVDMKYQKFEEGLKDVFHNAEADVDIDALITNIHSEKRRKRYGMWLWGGMFATLVVLGLWGLNNVIEDNHMPLDIDLETSLVASKDFAQAKETITPSENTSAAITEKDKQDSESKSTQSENLERDNLNATTQVTAQETAQSATTISENEAVRFSRVKGGESNNNSEVISSTIIEKETIESTITTTTVSGATKSNFTTVNTASLKNSNSVSAIRNLFSMDPLQNTSSLLDYERELPVKDYVDCPSFKKSTRWIFDIMPEVGFILPIKAIDNNTNASSEIFDMRAQDETPLEGLQVGLYARVRPEHKPYYIKFGASYTRVSERMKLDISWTEMDTTQGIISITESQNGDTLTVIKGDIITETEFFRNSTDHYFLKMIDIPVAVGYTKSIGYGWRAGLEGGVQFNISMSSSGKLLESTGTDSYTDLPANGRFATNLGVSFFGGLTFEKAISRNGALYFSPRFRYFPRKFTPDSYSISQGYQFAGIHAGYIHTF